MRGDVVTPCACRSWSVGRTIDDCFAKAGEPNALGTIVGAAPPVGRQLRHAFTDQYGEVWHDAGGYLYRGPEYRPRFEELRAADPVDAGGWKDMGPYFMSAVSVPTWRNRMRQAAEYFQEGAAPLESAGSGLLKAGGIALGIAGLYFFGPAIASALKRGPK
jgi:hypothetical protein